MNTFALITIGQSPRDDVAPDILRRLPAYCRAIEAGALDGLSPDEIAVMAPRDPGEALVTRLRNGSSVAIGKSAVVPRLQSCLNRLASEIDVAVVMCTGEFPMLKCAKPIIEPDRVLLAGARALHRSGPVGVLVPMSEQVEWSRQRFASVSDQVIVEVGSPYRANTELAAAATRLRDAGCRLIVLNCMGFADAHKALVREVAGCAVLQPASLTAKFIDEVLA